MLVDNGIFNVNPHDGVLVNLIHVVAFIKIVVVSSRFGSYAQRIAARGLNLLKSLGAMFFQLFFGILFDLIPAGMGNFRPVADGEIRFHFQMNGDIELVVDDVKIRFPGAFGDIEGTFLSFGLNVLELDGNGFGGRGQHGEVAAFGGIQCFHAAVILEEGGSLHGNEVLFLVVAEQRQNRVNAFGLKINVEFMVQCVGT